MNEQPLMVNYDDYNEVLVNIDSAKALVESILDHEGEKRMPANLTRALVIVMDKIRRDAQALQNYSIAKPA